MKNSPITQNPNFLNKFLWQAFGDPLGKDARSQDLEKGMQYYRPLVSFSFWLDYKLWGLNAAGFHLTNMLLHSLNVLLLFLLVARCFNDWLAAFAAASLFAVFPTNFENVAWISGRTDLLALLFLLLSAHCFFTFVRSGHKRDTVTAALFFFLALLSKEAVILSLLVYIYAALIYGEKGSLHPKIYFLLTFSIAVMLFFLFRSSAVEVPRVNFSIIPPAALFSGIGFYLSRGLFPFFLGFSIPDEKVLHAPGYFLFGIGFCLFLGGAVVYFLVKKKSPPVYLPWGMLSFLLLLPSLFILFFENPVSLLAWRFMYLPLAAAVPMLAVFLARRMRPFFYGLLVTILLATFAIELLPHVRHYGQSDRAFWLNLRHLERESRLFRLNHAANLISVNEQKAAALLEPFIADRTSFMADFFNRRALEIGAFHFTASNDLKKAQYYFDVLFSRYAEQPLNVYFQYAVFLAKSGNREKGREIVMYYLRVFPENHEVLLHAADFYLLIRDYSRALQILQKDFRLFPTNFVQERIGKLQSSPAPD
ncbi:MAG: glycosyltransferase family 39 protein [Candidatus Aminicenantes bacterium]|nr:glycosyltransferase family 39 protein [Candidatus Aminicenantes bacterium]